MENKYVFNDNDISSSWSMGFLAFAYRLFCGEREGMFHVQKKASSSTSQMTCSYVAQTRNIGIIICKAPQMVVFLVSVEPSWHVCTVWLDLLIAFPRSLMILQKFVKLFGTHNDHGHYKLNLVQ